MTDVRYVVGPVDRALRVLDCVAEEGREMTLTEVSTRLRLPKTTAFRYLTTLARHGLVAHDPRSDRYRPGARLWALGQAARRHSRLGALALPLMQEIRDRFNETVNLGELDGAEVVYREMVESRRSLRMQARPGSRDPAYATALGKAVLAFLPEERWQEHLPARLVARTPRTITTLPRLREDLREARRQGFARDRGENEEGSHCVGAPVLGPQEAGDPTPVAALSVSAPDSRMNARLERDIAEALRDAAARLRALL